MRLSFAGVISVVVVCAAFALYGFLMVYGNPKGLDDIILGRILGTADMSLGIVLTYWLGSSVGSRQKDETIATLSKT
jgi:hypothetical protein